MDGVLPPPEGVDLRGLKQVDSHRGTVLRKARKGKVKIYRGGKRHETVERESKKATLHVPSPLQRAAARYRRLTNKWDGDRLVRQASAGVVVYNEGNMKKNILIGHPTLGSIRYEWHVHRMGQIIPINWQSGQIASNHLPDPIAAGVIGYHTADAQNVIAWHAVKNNFEWLLLWEDDVLFPGACRPITCTPVEGEGKKFYRAMAVANGGEIIKSLGLAQAFDFGGCGGPLPPVGKHVACVQFRGNGLKHLAPPRPQTVIDIRHALLQTERGPRQSGPNEAAGCSYWRDELDRGGVTGRRAASAA